jgi:hypothetical protein
MSAERCFSSGISSMARFQDAWLTHQQRRFMRPDAPRYVRHDAGRYVRPDVSRWLTPDGIDVGSSERKFNPDQLRVPAGSSEGGQWTADGGGSGESVVEEILSELADLTEGDLAELFELLLEGPEQPELSSELFSDDVEFILVAGKGPGHHWIARQVFESEKYSFSGDTLSVFENAVTGPLNDPSSNRYDQMHREYNKAVGESLDRFLDRNGIRSDQMTPDQARQFVDETKRSSDPRIRQFNRRLLMREINYWMRRPRGVD